MGKFGKVSVNDTKRKDFPQQDAIGPDITLKGVDTGEETLWGHPLDRETSLEGQE